MIAKIKQKSKQHRIYSKATLKKRAECVITKTYKLTHFKDEFRNCLDKPYRNKKLLSAAGQIVS